MYPNVLLSVFIALMALAIIGGIVGRPGLGKAAGVLMVATVATALILWLLMGLSPAPRWLTRAVAGLLHAAAGLGHR